MMGIFPINPPKVSGRLLCKSPTNPT